MSNEKKNVAKQPFDPLFQPGFQNMEDYDPMNIGGPGGRSTNSENNERGILSSGLFRVMARHTQAALSSAHDAQRQGIYRTNSVGDND